ncbi:MAG: hypothetical protein DRO14_00470 [Thermoprotei archaeon]|nr:MAG: hypothetical protein DRO14_00470 [Thermoprotei archaeon]
MISQEEIRRKVSSDPRWAIRALLAIYARQEADEQATGRTVYRNGVGFNARDAEILTSIAERVLAGQLVSQKQMNVVLRAMPKYSSQLAEIAEERGA